MLPFEAINYVQDRIWGGKKLTDRHTRRLLSSAKTTVLQDQILLTAECARMGLPEFPDFTLDKSFERLYTLGRSGDWSTARYNEQILKAMLRAREFEKENIYILNSEHYDAVVLVTLANYLYELREQKYGTN